MLEKYLKKTATEDESTDAGDEGNTKKRELAAARRIDCVGDAAAAAKDKKVEAMTAATLTTKDEVVAQVAEQHKGTD